MSTAISVFQNSIQLKFNAKKKITQKQQLNTRKQRKRQNILFFNYLNKKLIK